MSKPICYLDMDGVIADFVTGCFIQHNRPELKPDHVFTWDFHKTMLRCDDEQKIKEFWDSKGFDFWANLPLEPWAYGIISTVQALFGDRVLIVTSVPSSPASYDGKREWIRKHFPIYKDRVCACTPKWMLAHPNALLIDDRDENVEEFVKHGGRGILFPRSWNKSRDIVEHKVHFLRRKIVDFIVSPEISVC